MHRGLAVGHGAGQCWRMAIDWTGALERAQAGSPFLSRAMDRLPDLVALLTGGDGEAALAWARRAGEGAVDTGQALRRDGRRSRWRWR